MFIAIWVAVSLAIAFYLFGWFTLPHDSKVERLGVFRFSTGLVFMMFAVYLVPGMWGAPVNLISGFPSHVLQRMARWGGSAEGGHAGHVEARFDDHERRVAVPRK